MKTAEVFVTEGLCEERRGACKENREQDKETRDAWIGKLERKIDWIMVFAATQLVALIFFLLSVITAKN